MNPMLVPALLTVNILTILGIGYNIIKKLADVQIKVDLMWTKFAKEHSLN